MLSQSKQFRPGVVKQLEVRPNPRDYPSVARVELIGSLTPVLFVCCCGSGRSRGVEGNDLSLRIVGLLPPAEVEEGEGEWNIP